MRSKQNRNMPKLSIITINLNAGEALEKTIKTIISQSFADYELIIIDGGSTDGSTGIIEKYESKISYTCSEPDSGIYNAMNKGILKAKGDYCFFLNSGDYLSDTDVLDKIFKADPSEEILFGNLYVTMGGKIIGKIYGKQTLTFSDVYSNVVKHQAAFIRRSLFEKFGLYNENRKIIADWEFFLKTLGLGNVSYRYIDVFISYFDNDGISNRSEFVTRGEVNLVIQENIPYMMQPDYEYLSKYKKYEKLFKNRFSFLFLRALNKIMHY